MAQALALVFIFLGLSTLSALDLFCRFAETDGALGLTFKGFLEPSKRAADEASQWVALRRPDGIRGALHIVT